MTADERLVAAVREQVGLGRLVALGQPQDGAWLAERAAGRVLRRAVAAAVPDVRVVGLRLALEDPTTALAPAVPPPPSGLPSGPLRIAAECAAGLARPVPEQADQVREALLASAAERLGLAVSAADVHVVALLDEAEPPDQTEPPDETEPAGRAARDHGAERPAVAPDPAPDPALDSALGLAAGPAAGPAADPVAEAVLAVPGVLGLSETLSGAWRQRVAAEPDRRLVRLQLVLDAGRRTLDVVRDARGAAAGAAAATSPDPVLVSLLVTHLVDGT